MTTASKIAVGDSVPVELAVGLKNVILYTNHFTAVYIGGSGVTAATGFPLAPNTVLPVPVSLALTEKIYGISPAGYTNDVHVLTFSVL